MKKLLKVEKELLEYSKYSQNDSDFTMINLDFTNLLYGVTDYVLVLIFAIVGDGVDTFLVVAVDATDAGADDDEELLPLHVPFP